MLHDIDGGPTIDELTQLFFNGQFEGGDTVYFIVDLSMKDDPDMGSNGALPMFDIKDIRVLPSKPGKFVVSGMTRYGEKNIPFQVVYAPKSGKGRVILLGSKLKERKA